MMSRYEFTLRFGLPSPGTDMDDVADRLYGGGCDDALVGIGHPGSVALDFTRRAASAREAVLSAIADVMRAIPGAKLIEVAPDLVGITDVAELVGCSRQNIRKLMMSEAGRVPTPVHEGRPSLWHLSPVLDWLVNEKGYAVVPTLADVAAVAMEINRAADALHADPATERELRALLA
jgi:predicted DNA-binding transcriptional regulator AlpA